MTSSSPASTQVRIKCPPHEWQRETPVEDHVGVEVSRVVGGQPRHLDVFLQDPQAVVCELVDLLLHITLRGEGAQKMQEGSQCFLHFFRYHRRVRIF